MAEKIKVKQNEAPTKNARLLAWVEENVRLCKPDAVHWCDGSEEEYFRLCDSLVESGTPSRASIRNCGPTAFWRAAIPTMSRASKTALSFAASAKVDAGPTNNWREPREMKATLTQLFDGCMKGRTMYVLPFSMGPLGSPMSHIGVELVRFGLRRGQHENHDAHGRRKCWTALGEGGDFVPCLHSVGMPLEEGQLDVPWPCNRDTKYIVHFPHDPSIWSYGSGYGGNALLGKKCFALRIASNLAREQGWLAEHMLIMGVESPEKEKTYVAAAFPFGVRQNQLRDADSARRDGRLESHDRRRRHRLD